MDLGGHGFHHLEKVLFRELSTSISIKASEHELLHSGFILIHEAFNRIAVIAEIEVDNEVIEETHH